MRTTRLLTSAAVAAAALLAVPALAGADSIVYIDGGNVWSATPDGARKLQLTDGGGWHSPTQADDGTIAAVQGVGPIRVMARDGRPLRSIRTATARTANGGTFEGRPVALSFSPDGTKIAYSYVALSCPPASTCREQQSTFYTRADVTEATPQAEWGNQFGASNPEWITNDRALVQNASVVAIDPLGGGDYSFTTWLSGASDVGDPELSRDGRRLATTFGHGAEKLIAFFAVAGDPATELPPAPPAPACNTSEGDVRSADPTWSPDGSAVAWEDKAGVNVYRFTELSADRCAGTGPLALAPTGSSPDWGPADPPVARWTPPAQTPDAPVTPGAPVGTPTGPSGGAPVARPRPATLRLMTASATLGALRRGLVVRLTAPKAGKVVVTLSAQGRAIARGVSSAKGAGTLNVRLTRLSARRAAALKGRTVRLTAKAGTTSATRSFRVR